jgi:hypothetical protein
VRVEHGPCHEHQVNEDNPRRHWEKRGPRRVLIGCSTSGTGG